MEIVAQIGVPNVLKLSICRIFVENFIIYIYIYFFFFVINET